MRNDACHTQTSNSNHFSLRPAESLFKLCEGGDECFCGTAKVEADPAGLAVVLAVGEADVVLAREPRALLFHDPADLFLRRAIRRANDELPVFIEPQPDGPPVCADDGVAFHQYHAHPKRRIMKSHSPTV